MPVLDTVSSDHSFRRFLRGTREELEDMGGGAKSSERPSYGMITTSSSSSSSSSRVVLGALPPLDCSLLCLEDLLFVGDLGSSPDSGVSWGASSRNTVGGRFLDLLGFFSCLLAAFSFETASLSISLMLIYLLMGCYVCVYVTIYMNKGEDESVVVVCVLFNLNVSFLL